MATYYIDDDVSVGIGAALAAVGDTATTALAERLQQASDAQQLLFATQREHILVLHNCRDSLLLHRAWLLWRQARSGYALPDHPGILRIPQQRWPNDEAARQIDAFLQTRPALTNMLYQWTPSQGWVARY